MNRIFIFAFAFLMIGCNLDSSSDSSGTNEKMMDLVKEQRLIWVDSNIRSYIFTYHSIPSDCPTIDPMPPQVITVENGEVSSVILMGSGAFSGSPESAPTIDLIFDEMEEKLEENPIVFSKSHTEKDFEPMFNELYGFPIQYHYDQSGEECDGWTVTVTGFQ